MYVNKYDANNNPITEAITGYKPVKVPLDVALDKFSVEVPSGAYTVIVKGAPAPFIGNINGHGELTFDIGDHWGPFLHGIKELKITTDVSRMGHFIELVFIY